MLSHNLRLSLLGIMLLWPVAARASVLTFALEGPITHKDDRLGLLGFANVGDRVVYTFSFDTEAANDSVAPRLGEYRGLTASLQVAGTLSQASTPVISIQQSNVFDVQSALVVGGQPAHILLRLSDLDNTAIPTPELPTAPYNLTPFESKYFDFNLDVAPPVPPDTYVTRLTFAGSIDRFYIVPEPASWVVCASWGLMMLRRRRR